MNFTEIAKSRYSCRKYDSEKAVEKNKLDAILNTAILSPSACNSQPYHITVCTDETAKKVAKATSGMGLNGFAADAPILLVISEEPYNKTALRKDKKAVDQEIERLTRLAAMGGFIPCPDHRLMPGTKFELVQYYAEQIKKIKI